MLNTSNLLGFRLIVANKLVAIMALHQARVPHSIISRAGRRTAMRLLQHDGEDELLGQPGGGSGLAHAVVQGLHLEVLEHGGGVVEVVVEAAPGIVAGAGVLDREVLVLPHGFKADPVLGAGVGFGGAGEALVAFGRGGVGDSGRMAEDEFEGVRLGCVVAVDGGGHGDGEVERHGDHAAVVAINRGWYGVVERAGQHGTVVVIDWGGHCDGSTERAHDHGAIMVVDRFRHGDIGSYWS